MDYRVKGSGLGPLLFFAAMASVSFIIFLQKYANDFNYPPLTRFVRFSILAIFSIAFIGYWLIIKKTEVDFFVFKRRSIIFGAISLGLLLCMVYPIFSIDLYEYIIRGRILSLYNANPYTHPPVEFKYDIYYSKIFWKYQPMIYGPIWAYLVSIPAWISQKSIFFTQFSVKFLVLIFHCLSAFFVYKIAAILKFKECNTIMVSYLLNPFVLIMGLVEGHLDIVMVSLLLASLCMLYNGRTYFSALFLSLSVLTKFLPIIFVPFYVVYIYSSGKDKIEQIKKIFISFLLALGVIIIAYSRFWEGWRIFSALKIVVTGFDTNTFPFVYHKIFNLVVPGLSEGILRYFLYGIFIITYLISAALFILDYDKKRGLINSMLTILSAYIFFASFQLGAWYITWIIPFLLLSQVRLKFHLTALLSYASLISFWKRISFLIIAALAVYITLILNKRRRAHV